MQSPIWLLFAILSAAFAALVAIFGKLGLGKVDTTVATMARAAIMFLFLLITVLLSGKMSGLNLIHGRALVYILLAGVAGALSWIFYFWALKLGRASAVASVDRTSVVMVIVLAALFLGEKIGWKTGLGAVLIAAGAVLVALA